MTRYPFSMCAFSWILGFSSFVDAGSVGFWALDAMKDAVAINAISGVPVDGRLYIQPARNAKRAEAAKILMMFHETMTK